MHSHTSNQARPLTLAIALALIETMLVGCGGGGGGGMVRADAPPPVAPPPPSNTTLDITGTYDLDIGRIEQDVHVMPSGHLWIDTLGGTVAGSLLNEGTVTPYGGGFGGGTHLADIGGHYRQTAAGTLRVSVGQWITGLYVHGNAVLEGGTLELMSSGGGPLTALVLHADGTITGQFANVVLPSVFLSGTLNYGAHDITVALTPVSATSVINNAGVGDAATQAGASNLDGVMAQAGTLEAVAPESLGTAQRQFIASVAAIRRAGDLSQAVSSLDSLSGQAYASTRDLLLDSSERLSLLEHLAQGRHSTSHAWVSTRSNGVSVADTGAMQANVVRSGTQGGIDQKIGDDLIVGFAAGNGEGQVAFERGGDQARMQLPSATAYAHFTRDHWHATALLDQTRATLSMQRWIDLGDAGRHRADSQLELDKFGAYFESGREFRIGRNRITPFVGVAYDALHGDAFVEHGDTGFELIGQAAHTERTTTDLGLRYRRDWHWGGDGWARLSLDGIYRHALHAGNDALRAAYVGAPQVEFGLPGLATDRDARWLNLGLDLGRGDRWSGFVRYDRSVVGDDGNQAWRLGAMWKF